jgi:hypothetical protein
MSTSDPDLINGLVNRMKDAATGPDGRIDAKAVVVACSKLAMLVLIEMSKRGPEGLREATAGASIAALGFRGLALDLEQGRPS